MEHTTYASRLRYLDTDVVDDSVVDYDDLDVRGPDDDRLGDLDGFIVDTQAGRIYYVVIDAGGWFRSRRLLIPIGHATLDAEAKALRVDVTRDALSRYPEFDESRFQQFTDDDLRQFETRMVEACCPGEAIDDASVRTWAYDTRKHYAQPGWWKGDAARRERLRPAETPPARTASAGMATPPPERHRREEVVARKDREGRRTPDPDDGSPHFGGRAQPGDVLGIETGGETSHVGDTAEDEDKRRRDAEEKPRGRGKG